MKKFIFLLKSVWTYLFSIKKEQPMTESEFKRKYQPDCFVVALNDDVGNSRTVALEEARALNKKYSITLLDPIDIIMTNGEKGLGYRYTRMLKSTKP
tara:strand:+ start:4488 stop:4778 length:291 start_codon:yes stop_codon:yes gene_type:complete